MATLSSAKETARRRIDNEAGAARLRYITEVPGQQAVYMRKKEQATAYMAAIDGNPAATVPPYIASESAALQVPAAEVAQTVLVLAALWEDNLSPAIEATRVAGKAAVDAAEDLPGVDLAVAAAVSALIVF